MSSIPKSLRPWTAELSLIHPNCWPLLGKLLPKLGNAMFRPAATANNSQQPPDGFDGVSNKGTLSRLLPTEWGLLETYSDEFYRRLTMGESQYLRPGYQQQQPPQAFYALLDRGPDQYGAPFLVQFALLLVLARRAREVSRPLHVGFVQNPGEWIVATPDNLQEKIHAHKSHARIMPEMVELWKLDMEQSIDPKALWIAASPKQSDTLPYSQLLTIDTEVTEINTTETNTAGSKNQPISKLSVLFHPRQQRLYFRLPNNNEALHLLRNPFKALPIRFLSPSTGIELTQFQLHPTARTCFFYANQTLLSIRIPKQMRANSQQLKNYKQKIKHQLVGVWLSKNQTATEQVDDTNIYCSGFFQQAQITVPLSALSQSFVSPQISKAVPLAYTVKRNRRAVLIIKDGEEQGFALYFRKEAGPKDGRQGSAKFIFEKAIALGPIQHELLVEQSFFYTDNHKTLYEIKLENDSTQPLKLDCDYPIYGLMQRYGQVTGRYISALPLMKTNSGAWVESIQQEYAIHPDDQPIGGNSTFMIVRRSESEIWQLPRDISIKMPSLQSKPHQPEVCLIQEKEPIVHATYQARNQWIVYQTASQLKTYSIKNKSETISIELAQYAV